MVFRKNLDSMNKKSALISVYNKSGLKKLCRAFADHNIDMISTGETANKIKSLGYSCRKISNLTKFREILEGRVKTLHPKIYASILFKRNSSKQLKEFKKLTFPRIDFVIVNLYPFEKYKNKNQKKTIEMIDVGGVTLIRSSAKNFNFVTSLCDYKDYDKLINNLKKYNGSTSIDFRKKMAQKVFKKSANYDLNIAKWFNKKNKNKDLLETKLRYGENPHQKALLKYKNKKSIIKNLINNKQLSYNNILDFDAVTNLLEEFNEPTCVIVKHNNPCGVGSAKNINLSFNKAFVADKQSAFGGIVGFNRTVNYNLAKKLYSNFFEIIIAKNFSKESIKLFKNKKNLIIIKTNNGIKKKIKEIRSINSGILIQQKNNINIKTRDLLNVSKIKASQKIIEDLIFCFKVCKHVKSNAIVIGKNKQTFGIGAGQMSRVDATKLALSKASKKNKNKGFVAASDAFFPFIDSLKLLLKENCKAVVQPKGSKNDHKIINYVNKNNMALYFSNFRFFKH